MNKERCIICRSEKVVPHYWPPTVFNGHTFRYFRCQDCNSLSIFPYPDRETLHLMYNEDFHPYLKNYDAASVGDPGSYRKFTAQRYQLDFLHQLMPAPRGKKLLDFGCGGGIYLLFARKLGYEVTGIEFDVSFAEDIRKKTSLDVFSLEELQEKAPGAKFDIIHFGHNLEHLEDPYNILSELRKFAHPGTLFVIDGPLENNPCFSRSCINLISRIKKQKPKNLAPYHLSFTNYDSQLLFFSNLGMKTVRYIVKEQYWPMPEFITWSQPSSILRYLLARVSIFMSSLTRKHGNIFHYVGKYE